MVIKEKSMPNWCMNKLTVSHPQMDMVDRFEKAYNLGKACSEFLPLPEGGERSGILGPMLEQRKKSVMV
jgi:hypothetical protein